MLSYFRDKSSLPIPTRSNYADCVKIWETCKFKPTDINHAVRVLGEPLNYSPIERADSFSFVEKWVNAHEYPTELFRRTLERRAKKINSKAVVVKRLKRIFTIVEKLKKAETSKMEPSRMHDIGGCRVILENVQEVYKLVEEYKTYDQKQTKVTSECIYPYEKYDYIQNPRSTGYRGIHLVYRYKRWYPLRNTRLAQYEGLKVEIQFRSRLQHAWSTAVEIVDAYRNSELKSGGGSPEWKRFFVLASALIAKIENTPHSSFGNDFTTIQRELGKYTSIINTIEGFNKATEHIHAMTSKGGSGLHFLLHLNAKTQSTEINGFLPQSLDAVSAERSKLEQKYLNDPMHYIVVVKAATIADLKKAYPNYFLDLRYFTMLLKEMIFRRFLEYDNLADDLWAEEVNGLWDQF